MEEKHCEFEDQSHHLRVLYILSQGAVIQVLTAVMSLRCIQVV